jgi:hypothetical protein
VETENLHDKKLRFSRDFWVHDNQGFCPVYEIYESQEEYSEIREADRIIKFVKEVVVSHSDISIRALRKVQETLMEDPAIVDRLSRKV